jgi:hypothetical protein
VVEEPEVVSEQSETSEIIRQRVYKEAEEHDLFVMKNIKPLNQYYLPNLKDDITNLKQIKKT